MAVTRNRTSLVGGDSSSAILGGDTFFWLRGDGGAAGDQPLRVEAETPKGLVSCTLAGCGSTR